MTPIDAFISMSHYAAHLQPVLDALPPERRGHVYATKIDQATGRLMRDLLPGVIIGRPPQSSAPAIVGGYQDHLGHRPTVLISHGAGQVYAGVDLPSYDGGPGREHIGLFICPREESAARNRNRYPGATACAVGCPKLDGWAQIPVPENLQPVIAVSFHWHAYLHKNLADGHREMVPEGGWSFPSWRSQIADLALQTKVLGHGHPRARQTLANYWASIGVEQVWDPEELLRRADVLVIDNSCVTPDALVLCEDLVWREAGSLQPGDRVIGCDEERTRDLRDRRGQVTQREDRRFRTATVTSNEQKWMPCVAVETEHGRLVTSTSHPWLVRRPVEHHYPAFDKRRQRSYMQTSTHWRWDWVNADQLRPGDEVAWFGEPWTLADDRESGWLAGMFDGEGCLHVGSPTKHGSKVAALSISQNKGTVLNALIDALGERKLSLYTQPTRGVGKRCYKVTIQGKLAERLAFLGSIRPERLVAKARAKEMWDGTAVSAQAQKSRVIAVNPVGQQRVCVLSTDRLTFIANGFIAHNSFAYEWAALGRPVVLLNDAEWRPQVEHGLRFWDKVPGPQVWPTVGLDGLLGAIRAARTEAWAVERRIIAEDVYGALDGKASERAAEAILCWEREGCPHRPDYVRPGPCRNC